MKQSRKSHGGCWSNNCPFDGLLFVFNLQDCSHLEEMAPSSITLEKYPHNIGCFPSYEHDTGLLIGGLEGVFVRELLEDLHVAGDVQHVREPAAVAVPGHAA